MTEENAQTRSHDTLNNVGTNDNHDIISDLYMEKIDELKRTEEKLLKHQSDKNKLENLQSKITNSSEIEENELVVLDELNYKQNNNIYIFKKDLNTYKSRLIDQSKILQEKVLAFRPFFQKIYQEKDHENLEKVTIKTYTADQQADILMQADQVRAKTLIKKLNEVKSLFKHAKLDTEFESLHSDISNLNSYTLGLQSLNTILPKLKAKKQELENFGLVTTTKDQKKIFYIARYYIDTLNNTLSEARNQQHRKSVSMLNQMISTASFRLQSSNSLPNIFKSMFQENKSNSVHDFYQNIYNYPTQYYAKLIKLFYAKLNSKSNDYFKSFNQLLSEEIKTEFPKKLAEITSITEEFNKTLPGKKDDIDLTAFVQNFKTNLNKKIDNISDLSDLAKSFIEALSKNSISVDELTELSKELKDNLDTISNGEQCSIIASNYAQAFKDRLLENNFSEEDLSIVSDVIRKIIYTDKNKKFLDHLIADICNLYSQLDTEDKKRTIKDLNISGNADNPMFFDHSITVENLNHTIISACSIDTIFSCCNIANDLSKQYQKLDDTTKKKLIISINRIFSVSITADTIKDVEKLAKILQEKIYNHKDPLAVLINNEVDAKYPHDIRESNISYHINVTEADKIKINIEYENFLKTKLHHEIAVLEYHLQNDGNSNNEKATNKWVEERKIELENNQDYLTSIEILKAAKLAHYIKSTESVIFAFVNDRNSQTIDRSETGVNEKAKNIEESIKSAEMAYKVIQSNELKKLKSADNELQKLKNTKITLYRSLKIEVVNYTKRNNSYIEERNTKKDNLISELKSDCEKEINTLNSDIKAITTSEDSINHFKELVQKINSISCLPDDNVHLQKVKKIINVNDDLEIYNQKNTELLDQINKLQSHEDLLKINQPIKEQRDRKRSLATRENIALVGQHTQLDNFKTIIDRCESELEKISNGKTKTLIITHLNNTFFNDPDLLSNYEKLARLKLFIDKISTLNELAIEQVINLPIYKRYQATIDKTILSFFKLENIQTSFNQYLKQISNKDINGFIVDQIDDQSSNFNLLKPLLENKSFNNTQKFLCESIDSSLNNYLSEIFDDDTIPQVHENLTAKIEAINNNYKAFIGNKNQIANTLRRYDYTVDEINDMLEPIKTLDDKNHLMASPLAIEVFYEKLEFLSELYDKSSISREEFDGYLNKYENVKVIKDTIKEEKRNKLKSLQHEFNWEDELSIKAVTNKLKILKNNGVDLSNNELQAIDKLITAKSYIELRQSTYLHFKKADTAEDFCELIKNINNISELHKKNDFEEIKILLAKYNNEKINTLIFNHLNISNVEISLYGQGEIEGLDFSNLDLRNTQLSLLNYDFRKINFNKAIIGSNDHNKTKFPNKSLDADFSQSKFCGTIENAEFGESTMPNIINEDISFNHCELTEADFSKTTLSKTMTFTTPTRADLKDLKSNYADDKNGFATIDFNHQTTIDINNLQVIPKTLAGFNIQNTTFKDINLSNATNDSNYNRLIINDLDTPNANKKFTNVIFESVNFDRVQLKSCTFENCTFRQCSFKVQQTEVSGSSSFIGCTFPDTESDSLEKSNHKIKDSAKTFIKRLEKEMEDKFKNYKNGNKAQNVDQYRKEIFNFINENIEHLESNDKEKVGDYLTKKAHEASTGKNTGLSEVDRLFIEHHNYLTFLNDAKTPSKIGQKILSLFGDNDSAKKPKETTTPFYDVLDKFNQFVSSCGFKM